MKPPVDGEDPIPWLESQPRPGLLGVLREKLGKEAGDAAMRVYHQFRNDMDRKDVCADCERDNDPYMLRDDVWKPIAPNSDGSGRLCLSCCEKRLGRKLVDVDFTYAPINDPIHWALCR